MSDIKIQPSATGSATVTLTAPATGTARTVTLPDSTDTLAINSDVTNKLPLAGGTLTGDVSLVKASGNSQILVEASGTDAYATVRVKNDAKDYSMQIRSDQSDAWTIRDETAGANRLLISSTGDVTLGTGDLIFGAAGKGIVLGSTSNTNANTLDDYEEGTWTPSINDGSPTYTTTYARTGVYTKIGNLVHIYMELYMGAISFGDATQTLVFSGLPFASSAPGDTFGMGMASSITWSSIYTNGSTYNTGSMADASILHASPTILSGSSVFRISLSGKSNIGRSYLKNAAFHNGSGMAIGLTYHTA
jgi:hypothetical protein